ncbi:spike base protein, RCAP_Rcc01079 family [Rhizobium leguminosarum]
MAIPKWNGGVGTAQSFGREGRTITPGASDLDPIAKAVVMLATGDITVVPRDNQDASTIAFTGLPAGYIIPFIVRRVTACSSSCAAIDA